MKTKIQVLVVDDSKVARTLLVHLLESDPRISVVGTAEDGPSALKFVAENKPDLVLMDIHMPDMDGFEVTRCIMETNPIPIIICTATTNPADVAITFRSMEAGAVACVEKPVSPEHPDYTRHLDHLLQTVKLMSEIKVVRRWPRSRTRVIPSSPAAVPPPALGFEIIGIGASTGGPPVLQCILAALPKDFPLPILVVQHIARGFLTGLAEWLNGTTPLQVHIGAYGVSPLPGHVYLAPDDFHMGLSSSGRIQLTREGAENGLRPSVSYLFRSLAGVCGANAIGILLTGMGKDGAAELKLMKDRNATTIAQDRDTSVVFGMPGKAVELDAATHVLPSDKIADTLITLVKRKRSGPQL